MKPPDEHGWVTLRLLFEMEAAACGYLLSFGPQVEIIEPLALREKVVELARKGLDVYTNST